MWGDRGQGLHQRRQLVFSSRRRHTRLQGDWSSDVCSSDLILAKAGGRIEAVVAGDPAEALGVNDRKRSEEHTSELQSPCNLVCRLLLEKKKQIRRPPALQQSGNPPTTPRGAGADSIRTPPA